MEEKEMYDFSVSINNLNKDIYGALVYGYLDKFLELNRDGYWAEFPAIEKIVQGTGVKNVEKIRQILNSMILSVGSLLIGTLKNPYEHKTKMVYCIGIRDNETIENNQEEVEKYGFKFYLNGEEFDITAINQ